MIVGGEEGPNSLVRMQTIVSAGCRGVKGQGALGTQYRVRSEATDA